MSSLALRVAASASDPMGELLTVAGTDGVVQVPLPPSATPQDTATPTITRTSRPTVKPLPPNVRTRKPTSTGSPLAAATSNPPSATRTRAGSSDGCATTPYGGSARGSLIGLAVLVLLRRTWR